MGQFARILSEFLSISPDDSQGLADQFASGDLPEALIEKTVSLVRTEHYDILDLHDEISQIRGRSVAQMPPDISAAASLALDRFFAECLRATARVQELALDTSVRGYAELDSQGRILNFNKSLTRLLGVENPYGQTLEIWFADEVDSAMEALESAIAAPERWSRQLRLTIRRGGETADVPVICEFGSIPGGDQVVAFALFHDISSIVDAEMRAFENAEFGILRVDPNLQITYCNREAASIIDRTPEDLTGTSVTEIVHPDSLESLMTEYDNRDEGLATRYSVDLMHSGARTQTIEVTALPEFDPDGQQRISALAFVRSIGLERVRGELRDAIESAHGPHMLLSAASQIIGNQIEHDKMVFTIYDGKGGWAWPIHIEPTPDPPWPTRWFEISPEVSNNLEIAYEENGGLIIPNIAEFVEAFDESDPLRCDPTMPLLISQGMRSTLTMFIKEENQFVASITFFSRVEKFFTDKDISTLRQIGVENLIRIGWRYFERRETNFFDGLSREIQALTRQGNPEISSEHVLDIHRRVAELITKKLSRFYRWRYVSIFQCDSVNATTRLLSAYGFNLGHREEFQGYKLGFDSGLIGLAVRRGETVVMDDCNNESEEADAFIRVNEETRAALCYPIKVQGRVVWILNIEDDRKGAFGVQDQKILSRFVDEMQIVLENLFIEGLLERIINESLDAIMIIDGSGTILRTNGRAQDLLGSNGQDLRESSVFDFIVEPEDRETIGEKRRLNQFKCMLQGHEGTRRHTLLTMRTLPECFGLRVVYVTDLKQLEWKHDIKVIGGAISKAAADTGEPIAFVDQIIKALARDDPENKEQLTSMARDKLSSVRLTYRRIAQSFPPPDNRTEASAGVPEDGRQLHELGEILQGAIEALSIYRPAEDWVQLEIADSGLPIWAARDHVEFVFQSALDFLRRRKADADFVKARVTKGDGVGIVILSCHTGDVAPAPEDPLLRAALAGRDLVSLGERGMKRIVESEHQGQFQLETGTGGETRFVITFPIGSEDRARMAEAADGI